MPFLYNAAPIPRHLLTRRNLATILVQCRCHSWTFTNKTKIDYFFWKCNCSGFTSHCTGIDHTLPRTHCSYSSGEPPLSGQVQYACRETRCYVWHNNFSCTGFPQIIEVLVCYAVACPLLERSGMSTACSRSASAHLYHTDGRLTSCDGAATDCI